MEKTGLKRIEMDDSQLISLALKDDQGAFSSLLQRYRPALTVHIMQNYVSVLEDAEDICQRSFEKAFMSIEKYNPRYAFSTWLYNKARTEAIDHLRSTRNTIPSISYSENPEVADSASEGTPEEKIIVDQAVQELVACIKNLPETYCRVAELRFLKDLAYEDIASQMDLPIGTVKTRINRARKMLIDCVGGTKYTDGDN